PFSDRESHSLRYGVQATGQERTADENDGEAQNAMSRYRTLFQVPFFLSLVLVPKFHGAPKTNRRLQSHASLSVPDHDHRAANFQRKIDPIPNLIFADTA
ncbi:hypothetical protein CABS03_09647, partial [Colletotrichum abscissum]